MRSATKKIVRASKESAVNAMTKHIEAMERKGWKVDTEFSGNCGCKYEVITWIYK